MASKRIAVSAVNWSELYLKCPRHQLDQFRDIKTKTDNIVSKIASLPESLPTINWDHYARVVPIPGLVDKFKKEYQGFHVEYTKDSGDVMGKVRAQGQIMLDNAKRHSAACEKMKSSAIKMKSAVSKLPPLNELTPEITMAYFPLTNISPFQMEQKVETEDKTILKKSAPLMHWEFN